jgi:hypothetical protein
MIKKDKDGYKVVSKKGKNLGSGYKTRAAAASGFARSSFSSARKVDRISGSAPRAHSLS